MAHLSTGRPNRLLAVAAGVVFDGLLALFPAITAVVSLYGLFANAATINDHLSSAAGVLPAAATDIIHEQIVRLTSNSSTKLGFAFISGLVIALWSANAGMKSVIDALNVVYGETGEARLFHTQSNIPNVYFGDDRPRFAWAGRRCRIAAYPRSSRSRRCHR